MKIRHVVVTLLVFVLAWALVPTCQRSATNWDQIDCATKLKHLATFGMLYADHRNGYFPHSPDGSLATLQQLVDAYPDDFRPELLICRDGQESPPAVVDRRLVLTPESCSYGAVPWRLKLSDTNAVLYYDKKPHHPWKGEKLRNVVLTDRRKVLVLDEDEFQKRIEEERARFGSR